MIEKSAPKWITEGQTIELTCKTNKPWNICRWTLPNGKNCDGNKVNLYEVACQYDSRIKFMVSDLFWITHPIGRWVHYPKEMVCFFGNYDHIDYFFFIEKKI